MSQNNQHEKTSAEAKYELMHARCLAIEFIQNTMLVDACLKSSDPLETLKKYDITTTDTLKELLGIHSSKLTPEQCEAYKSTLKALSDRFRSVDARLRKTLSPAASPSRANQ